jgi:hypothetical protein
MRLRAAIALLLLATGGCAHLPERVRVETDQGTIEVDRECPCEVPAEDDRR